MNYSPVRYMIETEAVRPTGGALRYVATFLARNVQFERRHDTTRTNLLRRRCLQKLDRAPTWLVRRYDESVADHCIT